MDNRVYSFNYVDKEKVWAPGFLYDGVHSFDDGLIPWDKYSSLKEGFVSNNLTSIKGINNSQHIDDYLGMSMMQRMRQNVSSDSAWQKILNIIHGRQDGTVMSMDIETLGDIDNHARIKSKYTGITEMGFAFQDFKGGFMDGDARHFTLANGFGQTEAQAAEEVLNTYKLSGWHSLTDKEQWFMRTMSSYGSADTFHGIVEQKTIPELGGSFYVLREGVESADIDPTDVKRIAQGIKNWQALGEEQARLGMDTIGAGTKYMADVLKENTMGIVSANSAYEASILGEALRANGASGEMLMNRSADVVYASTIMGRVDGMTSFRMQMQAIGHGSNPKAPNSVDSLVTAVGLEETEKHHGGPDALQNVKIATGHEYYDGKSFAQLSLEANQQATHKTTRKGQAASRDIIQNLHYGDQYFYMQRGSLDKNNIDTVVTTLQDGTEEATQNGSIRGRYYMIDETGSGWTKFNPMIEGGKLGDAEDVYVLKMTDAVDNERTVYKGFHNRLEADKWVERNMIGIDRSAAGDEFLATQKRISEIDIGRRKFDSFFNVADLTAGETGEQGGFRELQQYLEMSKASKDGDFTDAYKAKLGLKPDATYDEVLAKKGIKSAYQKVEYENAIARVRSEEDVLDVIVNEIQEKTKARENTKEGRIGLNVSRTAALKEARDKYIQNIESNSAGYKRVATEITNGEVAVKPKFQKGSFTVQDAYSLDVVLGGEVKRINGSNYENLMSSLNSAYKGATKKEIIASVDELLTRTTDDGSVSLLSKKTQTPFINLKRYLEDLNVPESGHYNAVYTEMANVMDDVFFRPVRENSKGPIKYFSSKEKARMLRFKNDIVGDAVMLNEQTMFAYADGLGKPHTMNALYQSGVGMTKSEIIEAADVAIKRTNNVQFAEIGNKTVMHQLMDDLGYTSDRQKNIIDYMFGIQGDAKYSIKNFDNVQFHIVSPSVEGGSAYGVFTTRNHANAVEKILLEGTYDTSTRKAMEESFGGNAAIMEFKALHKTKLMEVDNIKVAASIAGNKVNGNLSVFNEGADVIKGVLGNDIFLTTVSQGASQEKFVLPGIDSYIGKDGQLKGGFVNTGDSILSAQRMRFGDFLSKVSEEQFSSANRSMNNAMNGVLKDMASPNGRRTMNGQLLSLNDILHAFQFDGSGIRETLKNELQVSLKAGLHETPLVQLVEAVGYQEGIIRGDLNVDNVNEVLNSSAWKEFYAKNLLKSHVNADETIKRAAQKDVYRTLAQDEFSKNIVGIMIDQHDVLAERNLVYNNKGYYAIREGLEKVQKLSPYLSQIVSPGHFDDIMTLVDAGQFIDLGGMMPSLRPTYNQILNGMYFDPNDLDKTLMERLGKVDVKVGSSSQSLMEYALVNNVAGLNIKTPFGTPFNKMERQITATIKNMSDADLVLKYKELDKLYEAGQGVFDASTAEGRKYRRAYEIFKAENPSLHEGKMFGSSELLNQSPFNYSDLKKIRRHDLQRAAESDDTLRSAFLKHLDDNGELRVKEGETMFQHKYHSYVWEGPDTILTKQNIEDLLDGGETKVLPTGRMVNDVKFQFQDEKSMVHYTYIDDEFVKKIENRVFDTAEEARRYNGLIMDMITDYDGGAYRPMFIGNISSFKHGNQPQLGSVYRTIINEYSKVDNGLNDLVSVMNRTEGFNNMNVFLDNGKIITNQRDVKGLENAIMNLQEALANGQGNKEANFALFGPNGNDGILQMMVGKERLYLEIQRTNVNEVMAEKMFIDERMAQAIRMRAFDESRYATEEWINGKSLDDRYLEAIRRNALNGNDSELRMANTGSVMEDVDRILREIDDTPNQRAMKAWAQNHRSQQEVLDSMWNTVNQYAGTLDPKTVNAYVVNLDDVLDSFPDPKSIGTMDIKEKLFMIEGELPEYLKNTKANGRPGNIYFKFRKPIKGAEKAVDDTIHSFDGLLLPLYDIRKLENGELNFTQSQNAMAAFFNAYQKERLNTSDKDLTTALDTLMTSMKKELQMYDKDSFLYKTEGRFMMPNSRQLLGQDEMAPIVEGMWDDKALEDGLKRQKEIYAEINKNGINEAYIKELDEIEATRKSVLGKIADRIESGEQTKSLYELSDLKMLGIEDKGIELVNGKYMFANSHAMSSETMRKMGLNTGVVGYQVFKDIESQAANGRGIHLYETNAAFNQYIADGYTNDVKKMSRYLEDTYGIAASADDPGKSLMKQINEFTANYNIDKKMSRAARRAQEQENMNVVMTMMDVFGKRYLSDVGVMSDTWRPPIFSAQVNSRIYLDESVGYGQIRSYTGGLVSIQNNLDFDGDSEMVSLILNNKGGLEQIYDEAGNMITDPHNRAVLGYKTYMKNLEANNKIMARLVRDGSTFKKDALGDVWIASAKVVEKFDNDSFISGIAEFMKSKGIEGNAQDFADNLTVGRYAEFAHSDIMKRVMSEYSASNSTTTNIDIIRAAITARVRKENIGAISTPNYKLRDTLLSLQKIYDNKGNIDEANRVRSIIADLTGIGSDKVLDITEQKAIDVKHIVDAVNIAETGKWATGMNTMFSEKGDKAKGLKQMMEAVNNSTFKMDEAQLNKVYKEIIAGNRDAFRKEVQEGGGAIAELKLQFRSLYEITELDGASMLQNTLLRSKRTYLSTAAELVKEFLHMAELTKNGGSTLSDLTAFTARAYVEGNIISKVNEIYIGTPTVDDSVGRGFYQLMDIQDKGKNRRKLIFQELNYDTLNTADPTKVKYEFTGNYIEKTGTTQQLNKWLRRNFATDSKGLGLETPNIYVLENERASREKFIGISRKQTITKQLDDFIGENGIKEYHKFANLGTGHAIGEEEYNYLMKVIGSEDNLVEARELAKDYEQWYNYKLQNQASSGSGQDLLRQVNENIANNYHKGEPIDYTVEMRRVMTNSGFNMSANEIPLIRNERFKLGFDANVFTQKTNILDEIYDIIPSEKHIDDTFDIIDSAVDKAKNFRRPESEIDKIRQLGSFRASSIQEVRDAINKSNANILDTFNKEVFGTTTENGLITKTSQLDYLFRWGDDVQKNMRVGFGRYTGVDFKDLTAEQVQEIINSAKNTKAVNPLHQYSIDTTIQKIQGYTATATKAARQNAEKVHVFAIDISNTYKQKLVEITPSTYESVVDAIGKNNGMKHKKLSDTIGDTFRNVDTGKLLKGTGVVLGAMAALGIANNLLHNDSHKSPLSPEFSDDKNDPGFKNGAAHPDVEPRKTRGSKVYAEPRGGNGKGMQFKINARTQSMLSDDSNAKLINAAGHGQGNVMINKDNSKINDNWLANKFAQLSL